MVPNRTQTSECTWRGLPAVQIEGAGVRAVFVPVIGAKMVSLADTRHGWEWLVAPAERPLRPVPYGARFTDQDMSGWDEMFPTIDACRQPMPGPYAGVDLPDHGEVWALPWQARRTPDALHFTVHGQALPYRLERTVTTPSPGILRFEYTLTNLGDAPWPYLWAAHPQFVVTPDMAIVLPQHVRAVVNVLPGAGWGEPGTQHPWPRARRADGALVDLNKIGSSSLRQCRKFYVPPDVPVDWAALQCAETGRSLTMRWSRHAPYLGIWVDEGAYNPVATVALEPATAYYDNLALAWRLQRAPVIGPGERHHWHLTLELG